MKKVVVIGGGTGQSAILRGIKQIEDIEISTIVTVADDGGRTGRLRRAFHIPAMGDIRNVMCALAEEETLFSQLMEYRFSGSEDIGGHNLGNLILTALTEQSGSFMEAITEISKILNVKGTIIPATTQVITLYARMEDGTIVRGESNIPDFRNRISEVFYNEKVVASEEAVQAILEADMILIGIGSLYTSIMPNLIIEGIADAIKKSKAKRYYLCNAMTQPGETDYYTLEDHVAALEKHTFKGIVDTVIYTNDEISEEKRIRYEIEGAIPVGIAKESHDYNIIGFNLLNDKIPLVRHDPEKIAACIRALLKE